MSSSHSTSPSIWSIQEIVDLISKFLDRTSIVQCAQCSKAWHNAFLPSLWARIEPHHWRHETFLASLPAHGDLIRILKCTRHDKLELLGTNATRLSWLEMPIPTLVKMKDHIRILKQNRDSLQTLSLIFSDVTQSASKQLLPLLKTIRQLRSLKTLKFDGSQCLDEATLEYVLGGQYPLADTAQDRERDGDNHDDDDDYGERPSPIQEISLSEISFIRHPFNHGEGFASREYIASRDEQQGLQQREEDNGSGEVVQETRSPFTNITSLVLNEVNCYPELVLNLTSRFPSLQRLSLNGAAEFQPDPAVFPFVLARHCPQLRWLDISSQETMSDDFIATLIRVFPHLAVLKANDTMFSEESMQALADNCRDLVRLEISGCYNIQSSTIQRFLCQCSTLRHFDAWDNTLNAVDMVASFFWMDRRFNMPSGSIPASDKYQDTMWSAEGNGSKLPPSAAMTSALRSGKGGWWACARTLESLTIDIVYQPWSKHQVRQLLEDMRQGGFGATSGATARLHDHPVDSDDWTSTTNLSKVGLLLQDKKHIRNAVYQQLGQLINIRSLFVGGYELEPEDEDSEDDGGLSTETGSWSLEEQPWIDFSLASGLDHLSQLKKLAEISFIRIGRPPEHHVEQAELEWMLKHWPNLRKIEGLDQRNEDEEEGIDEDEPINELVAWLAQVRPDIIVDADYI